MKQSEELREYAKQLRNLVNENRANEHKMRYLINNVHYKPNVYTHLEVNNQVEIYIKETEKLNAILENYADELERIARNCEAACPPPMLNSCIDFAFSNEIKEWWVQAYPIIEQIATVAGAITGVSAVIAAPISFIKWIRSKLQEKKEKSEYSWIKLILQKNEWSVSVLAKKIDLSEEETKKILKGFGYVWNSKKMLYVETENTCKLRNIEIIDDNEINNIKF